MGLDEPREWMYIKEKRLWGLVPNLQLEKMRNYLQMLLQQLSRKLRDGGSSGAKEGKKKVLQLGRNEDLVKYYT